MLISAKNSTQPDSVVQNLKTYCSEFWHPIHNFQKPSPLDVQPPPSLTGRDPATNSFSRPIYSKSSTFTTIWIIEIWFRSMFESADTLPFLTHPHSKPRLITKVSYFLPPSPLPPHWWMQEGPKGLWPPQRPKTVSSVPAKEPDFSSFL